MRKRFHFLPEFTTEGGDGMSGNCTNCKKLMTRKKVGGEIETVCMIDNKIVTRIIECSEWEKKVEENESSRT